MDGAERYEVDQVVRLGDSRASGHHGPERGRPRPIHFGLVPAGSLEDVQDYWYWLATNACTAWGFQALADALADYGHPEAARLEWDAKAYRRDVLRAFAEAKVRAPVVRLRDGTYVPKYPSEVYARGRSWAGFARRWRGRSCCC